jgi:hypothetical protein
MRKQAVQRQQQALQRPLQPQREMALQHCWNGL